MVLLQYLVKKEIIDKAKASSLEYEIKISGKREEEMILEKGIVPEGALFELKSQNLNIPLKKIVPEEIPLNILELIPHDSAKYYNMIPLAKKDNVMEIGMVYPDDLRAQEALKFLARQGKFNYNISLIAPGSFENLLKQYRNLKKEVKKALEELEVELKTGEAAPQPMRRAEFERR